MEDAVGAVQRSLEDIGLQNVTADVEDAHPRIAESCLQILLPAADEIVVDEDLPDVLAKQSIGRVRADQTGAADEDQLASLKSHIRLSFQGVAVAHMSSQGEGAGES